MSSRDKTECRVSPWFLLAIGVVFAAGLAVLGFSLYGVQVVESAEFNRQSENQSVRRMLVPGGRGRILDRHGRVLAGNRPSYSIECYINELQRRGGWSNTVNAVDEALDRLADVVKVPRQKTRAAIERHVQQELAVPMEVYHDIDLDALARFAENFRDFPAFSESVKFERTYPLGCAAHLVGSVKWDRPEFAKLSDGDESAPHFYAKENRGRFGLERRYDSYLVGASGERLILVDARGYRHGSWNGRKAQAGPDLKLTVDAEIQKTLEDELLGSVGAGVVLDPRDGAVLALASAPTFDANDFVPSISSEDYAKLDGDPRKPLLNRAVSEYYAPGSTFKPITAIAALAEHVDPTREYDCVGTFTLGEWHLRCSTRWGHGPISMRRALEKSCNTYFCNLGHEIGIGAIDEAARQFGLGSRTGIDLDGEKPGNVPDEEWKMRNKRGERWYPGDTCQTSIGQGMLQVTPLQMAVVAAAFANGGKVYRPYLKARDPADGAPAPVREVHYSKAALELVRMGMKDVADKGTGVRIRTRQDGHKRYPLRVSCAGKTGTAEVGVGANRRKNTWIIAFAPFEEPTVAVAMVIENGESGGLTTAPKVHNVLARIFGEDEPIDSSALNAGEAND